MKICFVVPRVYVYFNTKITNNAGGAERQAYYLATSLSKNKKFDVHCCVVDFGQKPLEKADKITLWSSFNPNENRIKGFFKLFKILKKINADKYIFRSADAGTAMAILSVRFLLRKKTIYMIASNSETSFSELRKMSGLFTAILMPLVYKYSSSLTVQTENQNYLFKRNRKIIPTAIIKNIVQIPKETIKNNAERNNILWVGRLDKVKQPRFYAALAGKFPDQRFIMIAAKIKEDEKFGDKFIKSIKNIKNLEYIEYILPDDIKNYYKQAKIYVITSYTEGFSNTMAEAMSFSCPVLSLNSNPDNIFEKYQIGLCAHGEPEKFYDYFKKMINNADLRDRFALNGISYLRKNHDKEMILQSLINKVLLK